MLVLIINMKTILPVFQGTKYMNENILTDIDLSLCDIFEGMTSISAVIKAIKSGVSDRKILYVLYDSSRAEQKSRELSFLRHISSELDFELSAISADQISSLTSGETHGGIIAICTKRSFKSILFADALRNKSFFALIDGIEDPYNFGYSIRSLYASGVDGIVLPHRNWLEYSGSVARSSAGTSELADIYVSDTLEAVKLFKNNGFKVVCAGIRDSVSIYDYDFTEPVLLIIGGEKRGISSKIIALSDANVRIDYGREFMGSLPSASAVSIIAFEILRQKSRKGV